MCVPLFWPFWLSSRGCTESVHPLDESQIVVCFNWLFCETVSTAAEMAEMKVNRIVSHVSKVIYEWFLWLTGSSLAMKVQRSDSLARFLKQRPQQEELVQRHIIPTETEQQRLNHRQQIGATLNRSENSLAVFELLLSRVSLQRIGGGFIVSDTSTAVSQRASAAHGAVPRGVSAAY